MVIPSEKLRCLSWYGVRAGHLMQINFLCARRLDGVSDKNVENNPMQSRNRRAGSDFGDTEKHLTRRAKQGHYVMVAGARRRRDS
jgi:hypothetical protein